MSFAAYANPQRHDAGADAKANKGSDDDVAHWRPLSSHADRPLKRQQRVTTLAQSIQNGLAFIGAANLGRVAESRPQAAGAVKPQGGLDLLNVAALAVERRPLGAIGKDEDRVGAPVNPVELLTASRWSS